MFVVAATQLQDDSISIGLLLPAGSVSDSALEMQLVPEAENPFAHHPAPLQAGRKLQAIGRSQDAALAFEAAGRVSGHTHSGPWLQHILPSPNSC